MKSLDKKTIKSLINPRVASSHKGDYGHALIITGNKGRMGACVIAAKACLRCGAGLVYVNIPETERMILQTALPEAMVLMREQPIDPGVFSAAGIGPGLGTSVESKKILERIITHFHKPLLLDADALNIISEEKSLLKKITK